MGKEKEEEESAAEAEPTPVDAEWKETVGDNLENLVLIYQRISEMFQAISDEILPQIETKEQFEESVKEFVSDLPQATQKVFTAFLENLP